MEASNLQATPEGVSQLLTQLSGSDNAARQKAEADLKQLRQSSARPLYEGLLAIIQGKQGQTQAQALACMLLKRYYLDGRKEEESAEQLSLEDISALKEVFKTGMDLKEPIALLRRKAEIICKLHKTEESYGELVNQLQSLAGQPASEDETVIQGKELAMYMFELLAEYHLPQEQIVENSAHFMQLFSETLKDGNVRVRVATLKALTIFLSSVDDEEQVLKYSPMMEGLLDVVIEVLKNDEQQGTASLETLIELTQNHGEIWRPCTQKLLFVCSEIMKNTSFEWAPRSAALQIVTTVAEENPKLLRELKAQLETDFFPAICVMMTEVEHGDDLDAWANEVEEEILARNDPASVAAEALDRLAQSVGEKTTIAASSTLIREATQNKENWRFRQAGYIFLGMISESCEKTLRTNLEETVKMSAAGLIDEHPRVRYQALTSLGLLLNVLSPAIQRKFHAEMVPVLLKMMNEESMLKMKAQVVSCTCNFVRGLIDQSEDPRTATLSSKDEKEFKTLLSGYSAQLVEAISTLFQVSIEQNYAPLQEEALALLSCLAEVLSEQFSAYYATFMPGLKELLKSTPFETKTQQELRANCIMTIGCILDSVKDQPEVCREDARFITQNFVELLNSGKLTDADPQIITIQNSLPQLASCLQEEFKPFLGPILESLIRDAKRGLDFKIVDSVAAELDEADADEEGLNSDIQKIALKIRGMEGERQIQMNTTALENKLNAISIIRSLAQEMGKSFFEHAAPVVQLITEDLMHDKLSQSVRKEATKALAPLLHSTPDDESMKTLFKALLPQFVHEIATRMEKNDFRSSKWLLKEVQRCFKLFFNYKGQLVTPEGQSQLLDMCVGILKTFQATKVTKMQEFQAQKEKMDEEEQDEFMESIEKADRVWTYVMDITGTLLRTCPEQASPDVLAKIVPLYAPTLLKMAERQDYELIDSLCLLDDCIENGTPELLNAVLAQATPKFIEALRRRGAENQSLCQTAVFGLGVIAEKTPAGAFAQLGDVLDVINWIFSQELKDEDGNRAPCVDNAVGALGKCIYFHGAGNEALITPAVIGEGFLARLPLLTDVEEAQPVHSQFLTQVLAKNPVLAAHAPLVAEAARRLSQEATSQPDLEILDDQGRALLTDVMSQL